MTSLRYFIYGTICTLFIVFIVIFFTRMDLTRSDNPTNIEQIIERPDSAPILVTPNTVVIESMPTNRMLSGINVPFRGKASFQQVIVGRYAKNIVITYFKAKGENAHKSVIEITWEDGSVDVIPAGTVDRHFPPEKRAKEIAIQGYSAHERRIFRDSSKPGVLDWEILYISAED